jgi:cation diffusion facilitator family transporter
LSKSISNQNDVKQNLKFQKVIVFVGILLFSIKVVAWYFTNSVAILTDTLESIVNIITSFVGLYSLYLSSLPKDENHPYGHGKVEFISAAIEGMLIAVAGILIVFEAISNFKHPHPIGRLDIGIYLISATAVINYLIGNMAIKKGKKTKSLALEASGKHLKSDTYSTLGIILGLIVISFTNILWLDSLVALIFAGIIFYTGFKIIKDSISGIMDEADNKLIDEFVKTVQQERKPAWIDLHNLRIIKYGSTLHMDCHLTLPYYYNVAAAHDEIEKLDEIVNDHFGTKVELFIHTDPCQPYSCEICTLKKCLVRKSEFVATWIWDKKNVARNEKHNLKNI